MYSTSSDAFVSLLTVTFSLSVLGIEKLIRQSSGFRHINNTYAPSSRKKFVNHNVRQSTITAFPLNCSAWKGINKAPPAGLWMKIGGLHSH